MTKRFLLLFAVISMGVATAADSFRVNLYQPTVVSGTEFKAGDVKLELKDNKAVLKQGKTTAEATVKVESNKAKYLFTTVGYKEGADHKIKDICLAGTTTHVVFE
jgi:hypothetical protein